MREKLIEIVREIRRTTTAWHTAEDIADKLIANGVTIQRWIPVTERLPEENDRYLCNVKSFAFPGCSYHAILHYDKHGGFREGNIYTDDVTHWMPLPEPPKEEDQ